MPRCEPPWEEVDAVPAVDNLDPGRWRKTRQRPGLRSLTRDAARGKDAFTLLELLLVLAIVTISAALAAPRYGRASARYRADLAARRIVADLCLAQSYAKAASSARTVSFSAGTEEYRLLNISSPDGLPGDYAVVLSAEPYRADLTAANFNGGSQVIFSGWGLPDHGGTVAVSVGAEQRTVVVESGTGRIRVQ
jgi:prepilin-type N-terminal cleavage/methylation domain-containing protein